MKPTPLCTLISYDELARIVTLFYREVLADPVLAPYFESVEDWPAHERHIADFWWGLMGGRVESPRPQAMERGHSELSFGTAELERWLELLEQTLQENLPADIAQPWSTLAQQLGDKMIQRGMLQN